MNLEEQISGLLHERADRVRAAYEDYKAHAIDDSGLLAVLSANLEGLIRLVADMYKVTR